MVNLQDPVLFNIMIPARRTVQRSRLSPLTNLYRRNVLQENKMHILKTFCRNCAAQVQLLSNRHAFQRKQTVRTLATTVTLQRDLRGPKKRQTRKYQNPLPSFQYYGSTHRLLRGKCVRGKYNLLLLIL